jgi:putative AdoMet-dependent methyltransferase
MQLGAEMYDDMQMLRADYRKAMFTLHRETVRLLPNKKSEVHVLDVACGTAMATRSIFEKMISARQSYHFVGLDTDHKLLEYARSKWPCLKAKCADMAEAKLDEQFDLILCSFAYHHVPNDQKLKLCQNMRKWCKDDGDLLVLEICLTDNQVHTYYEAVKANLQRGAATAMCKRFLNWTMVTGDKTANTEWKVPLEHLLKDFVKAGWKLQEQKRVWSIPSLPANAGCYFLHFQKSH